MDREELNKILQQCPVRITMNDGSQYVVENSEQTLCSNIALDFLQKSPEDGKYRHVFLPLVTMSSVEVLSEA